MRNAFASQLEQLAAGDGRVVLLSGDIGNRLFDRFKEKFPGRFYNCGVAEANMMSVAAGLASCGLRPVVYTITPFVTTRCLEQIKVDVCYHRQNVVIVGVGAGLSYAELGATHHSCDDIAQLRALPGMSVVCPCDAAEVRWGLTAALRHDGPVYLRIGKKGEPALHRPDAQPGFAIGKAIVLREGFNVCVLCVGTIAPVALAAADLLEKEGISTRVVSLHTVKPLDEALLAEVFANFGVVVTVEEHSILGGAGSAVAEWLADRVPIRGRGPGRLLRIAVPDEFLHEAGDQDHARELFNLTPRSIVERTRQLFRESLSTQPPEPHEDARRHPGRTRPAAGAGRP